MIADWDLEARRVLGLGEFGLIVGSVPRGG